MIAFICARSGVTQPDDVESIGDKADYLWAKIMRRESACPEKIIIQLIEMMEAVN